MTMIAIAQVSAIKPAPFTNTPSLMLVLATQAGTGQHYIQMRTSDESMEMLQAEAQSLEMAGNIDSDELASTWTLIDGESDYDIDMAVENMIDANALSEGREVEIDEMDENVERVG